MDDHLNSMKWDESINRYVFNTFQIFVNNIISRSPELARLYGWIQYYGALDVYTEEYLIMSLNSFVRPMAFQIAQILNMDPLYIQIGDRLSVLQSLNRLTMMGYYSEWSGYGSTCLNPPNQRVLEYYPISWKQIGYPGPSSGYRLSKSYDFTKKQE